MSGHKGSTGDLRLLYLADHQPQGQTPAELAHRLAGTVERHWVTHPDITTEISLIRLVDELRSGTQPTEEATATVRAIMGLLLEYGEGPTLDYFTKVFHEQGLAALKDMTVGLGPVTPAYYATMDAGTRQQEFQELTRFLRENIACREELMHIIAEHPPAGMTIADPLDKSMASLSPNEARRILWCLAKTRFCGIGGVRRVRAMLPQAPNSIAESIIPKGALTVCPFAVIHGDTPIRLWFSYAGEADGGTSLDLVAIPFSSGATVRLAPVPPTVRATLERHGVVERSIPELAWWLSLGSGFVQAPVGGQQVTLLDWDQIAGPVREVLPWGRGLRRSKIEVLDLE